MDGNVVSESWWVPQLQSSSASARRNGMIRVGASWDCQHCQREEQMSDGKSTRFKTSYTTYIKPRMPRSYSRSPARSGKSDRKEKYTTRRRSRSKSREYDKYHRKESGKHRPRDRSKSRSVASHTKSSSYRNRSRDRKYKETSRKTSSSRDRYRRRKSNDRDRYRCTSSSSSSSSSSSTNSSRSSDSDSSSQSLKKSSPIKSTKESPEKEYVFKSLEDSCDEPAEKATKLQKLNADEFIPQTFVSSRKPAPTSNSAVSTNIVIDLESQIIKVPTVEKPVTDEDPIFHPMFFPGDESERMSR